MPRLDFSIERLFSLEGLELVFQSGAVPFVRTGAGKQEVLKQTLTAAQIVGAVAEILPPGLRAVFPQDGTTGFTYAAPAGRVRVRVDKSNERLRASLIPASSSDTSPDGGPADGGPEAPFVHAHGPSMPVPQRARGAALPPQAQPPLRLVDAAPAPSAPVPPAADPARAMGELLRMMVDRGASDLHLSSESPPTFRVDGDMVPHAAYRPISAARLEALLWTIAPERNREEWRARRDTDFAHETDQARFRVNVFMDRKGIGAVLRLIPSEILSAETLGLSPQILELCQLTKGLVLVTGPTGSGKSTTLAAMVDHVNRTRDDHIITLEDPIEFVHPNRRCLVNQREVGVHTVSFKQALRAALREDPDVLLVGELRDLETIALAIETAETGHLVFGTLHTNTAPSTVDRIIDQFPTDRQAQVRTMLSESLKGVVSQRLCKRIGGGRVAAHEVLLGTGGVSNLIREGKTFQIPSIMQTGRAAGMQTLNDSLLELVKGSLVTPAEALKKAVAKGELRGSLERAGFQLDAGVAA